MEHLLAEHLFLKNTSGQLFFYFQGFFFTFFNFNSVRFFIEIYTYNYFSFFIILWKIIRKNDDKNGFSIFIILSMIARKKNIKRIRLPVRE